MPWPPLTDQSHGATPQCTHIFHINPRTDGSFTSQYRRRSAPRALYTSFWHPLWSVKIKNKGEFLPWLFHLACSVFFRYFCRSTGLNSTCSLKIGLSSENVCIKRFNFASAWYCRKNCSAPVQSLFVWRPPIDGLGHFSWWIFYGFYCWSVGIFSVCSWRECKGLVWCCPFCPLFWTRECDD